MPINWTAGQLAWRAARLNTSHTPSSSPDQVNAMKVYSAEWIKQSSDQPTKPKNSLAALHFFFNQINQLHASASNQTRNLFVKHLCTTLPQCQSFSMTYRLLLSLLCLCYIVSHNDIYITHMSPSGSVGSASDSYSVGHWIDARLV